MEKIDALNDFIATKVDNFNVRMGNGCDRINAGLERFFNGLDAMLRKVFF